MVILGLKSVRAQKSCGLRYGQLIGNLFEVAMGGIFIAGEALQQQHASQHMDAEFCGLPLTGRDFFARDREIAPVAHFTEKAKAELHFVADMRVNAA
jgi:hypothetical protein